MAPTPVYSTVERQLVEWLPELRPAAEAYWESEGAEGDDAGPYILFEGLFRPFLTRLLAAPASPCRDAILRHAFEFIETMIIAGGDLHDLAGISVFEGQTAGWFTLADPFLGPRTHREAIEHGWATSERPDALDPGVDLYGIGPLVTHVLGSAA